MKIDRSLSGPPEQREFWQDVFYGPRQPGNFRPFGAPGTSSVAPVDSVVTPWNQTVTPDRALSIATVWACVSLRAAVISTLPIMVKGRDKRVLTNHPLYGLLHDSPNADMTASEFWEATIASLDLWGNAYARKDYNGGVLVALTPLRPERMTVVRANDGTISFRYARPGREPEVLTQDEVFHLKGFTVDGLVGLSPLKYAAQVMGHQIEANEAAAREHRNGLKVGGFLKTGATTLTDQQRERLRANLSTFSSPENASKWMVLEAGMEPVSANGIRMSPEDAQLLESRYFGIEELCRIYRVPPQLIGHTNKASSWASSLENTNLGWLQYGLRPDLVRIEQAIRKQLLPPEDRARVEVKFNVEGLLRADSKTRSEFYRALWGIGAVDASEIREKEDMVPREGADTLFVPVNMQPIDRALADPAPSEPANPAAPGGANPLDPNAPPDTPAEPMMGAASMQPIVVNIHLPDRKATGFTIVRDADGNAYARPNPEE